MTNLIKRQTSRIYENATLKSENFSHPTSSHCKRGAVTYSDGLFLDATHWQDFAGEWNFAGHGDVVTHRRFGGQRQQRRHDGAASARPVFRSRPLQTSNGNLDGRFVCKKYIHKIKLIHNEIHTYIIHTYTSRTHCLTCLKLILWAYLFCSAHRHTYTLTCSTVSSYWPQEHAGEGGTWLEIHFLALCSSERLWRRSKLFLHFPSWRRPVDLWSSTAPTSNSLLDRGGPNYGPGPYVTSEDFRSTWRLTFTVSHLNLLRISSVFRVIFQSQLNTLLILGGFRWFWIVLGGPTS